MITFLSSRFHLLESEKLRKVYCENSSISVLAVNVFSQNAGKIDHEFGSLR